MNNTDYNDIVGKKIEKLTVLKYLGKRSRSIGENTLCLYIHKSIKDDIFMYINKIIKYYKDGGKDISYSRIYKHSDGSETKRYGTFDNSPIDYIDVITELID